MATVKVAGLMPGLPTYSTRYLFYIAVIIPFIPIFKYAETFDDESVIIIVMPYFIFYLVCTVVITQMIKRIGKQWSIEEYNALKPDQITFPFILVMILNASVHFSLFYLLVKIIY